MKLKRQTVERLRDLARDYHTAYAHDRPMTLDEIKSENIRDYLTDPRRTKFKEIVSSLSKEERAELLVLVWLGRGDDNVNLETWDSLLEQAKREKDERIADYLIAKARLADYLDRGLEKLEGKKELIS